MINYCQLPGLIAERLFTVLDSDANGYLSQKEFLAGMLLFYCSTFDEKQKLVFDIYDFDNDGLIKQDDVVTIMSSLPVNQTVNVRGEGKFTREGAGAQNF